MLHPNRPQACDGCKTMGLMTQARYSYSREGPHYCYSCQERVLETARLYLTETIAALSKVEALRAHGAFVVDRILEQLPAMADREAEPLCSPELRRLIPKAAFEPLCLQLMLRQGRMPLPVPRQTCN